MSTLEYIRSRIKIVAAIVAFALLAFVLGDFISSGSTLFASSQTKMGEINGETIDYMDFQNKVNERETYMKLLSGKSTLGSDVSDEVREYCWEQLVRKNSILKSAEDQGLIVTDQELANMIQTGNVTDVIRRSFSNQDGNYDPAIVATFIQQKDAQSSFIWQTMENELRDTRQMMKYLGMVNAGLYVNSAEVDRRVAQSSQSVNVKYVAIPFTEIKDEEVNVSDAELKKVYEQIKKRRELASETRDLAYVVFNVVPTKEDSLFSFDKIQKLKQGFAEVDENDVQFFINSNSDAPTAAYNYSQGEIQDENVDEAIFNSSIGEVYGPYVDGNYYKLARSIKRVTRADSVSASHILVAIQSDSLSAKRRADSLLDVYNSGVSFEALAAQFSDDPSAKQNGGELGVITEKTPLIPEFKEACFNTPKGGTTIVRTQYGYHIIKVTDKTAPKSKISVGFVSMEIRPGSQTIQDAYSRAAAFAASNRTLKQFEQALQDQKLVRRVAPGLTSNTSSIPGIENSREMIRDAFDPNKSKEVSNVYEMNDMFIVSVVTGVHPKGVQSFDALKGEVSRLALNSAKGNAIANKIGNASSVEQVANDFNKNVQEAENISLGNDLANALRYEPKVVAVAALLPQGQVSKPVIGENAVYVLQNTSVNPSTNVVTKAAIESDIRNRATFQVYQSIIKAANVEDKRVKFY